MLSGFRQIFKTPEKSIHVHIFLPTVLTKVSNELKRSKTTYNHLERPKTI